MCGSLLQDDYGNCCIVDFSDHHEQCHDVEPKTIGQFTGFHDNNGDEIYEGDIIENFKNDIFVIMYAHGNIVLADREGNPWNICTPIGYALEYMDCNIIGNIHDNHELFKGGKE